MGSEATGASGANQRGRIDCQRPREGSSQIPDKIDWKITSAASTMSIGNVAVATDPNTSPDMLRGLLWMEFFRSSQSQFSGVKAL